MSAENPSEAVSESELPVVEHDSTIASDDGADSSPEPTGETESRRVSEAVPAPSAESAEAAAAAGYRVSLPMFEGPLDLLLHLVQKHELDILDIPIAFITEKYTAYIRMLDELNIDLASEYLVMAATLVHIKSRMLLPNAPVDHEDEAEEEELDPRADLVRRLLEYQKYKNAAEELAQRSITGKDVFPRGSSLESVGGQLPLMAVSMFQLIDVFQSVLERTSQTRQHEIDFERFSISEKISELLERLRGEGRIAFERIFSGDRSRGEIIVTFLALLEMTRLRLTWLFQDGPLEPIYVELRATDEEAAETNVAASEASFAPPPPRRELQEDSLAEDELEDLEIEDDLDAELRALGLDPEDAEAELEAELRALEPEQAELEAELPAAEPEPAAPELQAVPEQAELDAEPHATEPEPVEAELQAVEPEPVEAELPAVEPEPVEAELQAVEPEPVEAELPAVEPEQAELEVEPEAVEAELQAVEPEPAEIVAEPPSVEPQQDEVEAVLAAVEPEPGEVEVEPQALAPEQQDVEAAVQAVEPEQAEVEVELQAVESEQAGTDQDEPEATSNDTGVEQT